MFPQSCCTGYTECSSAAAWPHMAVLSRMPQSVSRVQTELYAVHTQTERAEEGRGEGGRKRHGGWENKPPTTKDNKGGMERSWASVFLSNAKAFESIDSFWTCCRESCPRVVK